MRISQLLLPTLKEIPKEAEANSHRLMLRAGMIRKLSAGFYCYLPLGWKVLLKIINIVRDEMDSAGALEVMLPAIHPQELWEKTERLQILGEDIIKFTNRSGKPLVLAPTHEEVITWLVANEVRSYKQLPLILYQIQTKFRDEPRPRFGVIRTTEFIMKDAYSFDTSWQELEKSYNKMYSAYCKIFERCGLDYFAVEADPGIMGGDISHEFMARSEFGEDKVIKCRQCNYSCSSDIARRGHLFKVDNEKEKPLKEVHTPGITTVEEVSKFLKVSPQKLLKTIIYKTDSEFIGILIRGDHEINEVKLRNYLKTKNLFMATPEDIKNLTKSEMGFSGPLGLRIRLIADYDVEGMKNFVTGANKTDYHLMNVNLERDFKVKEYVDIRYVDENDICPNCSQQLEVKNAIEIGHIFKLGTRYSKPLNAIFVDEHGQQKEMIMGCYGIGINRIASAFIEQNHDENGIIWNPKIAPYEFVVIATNQEDEKIKFKADKIYNYLISKNREVLYDDRNLRAGIKFNDADLIGIPYQIIIGERLLKEGKFELRSRDKKTYALLEKEEEITDYLK